MWTFMFRHPVLSTLVVIPLTATAAAGLVRKYLPAKITLATGGA